jgi:hypothetical protein
MDYLEIANWKRWQTARKDRPDWQPPWIKLHRRLMRNPEWVALPDHQKGQLVCLWLLAAEHGGKIPNSEHHLERVLCFSKKLNLQTFIDAGFIKPCPSGVSQLSDKRGQKAAKIRLDESRLDESRLTEPRAPTADGSAPDDAVFVTIPTNITKSECPIFRSQVESWRATFPGVDVEQQIREARQWCIDNPTKRKTYSGMSRYIYNWLSRRQNAGGGGKRPVMTPDEHLKQIEGRSAK